MKEDLLSAHFPENLTRIIFKPATFSTLPESKSTLFLCCALVAQEMNFTLSPPARPNPSIEEICEATQIRFRRIKLLPEWWKKKDLGPFIAFLKETNEPVYCSLTNRHGYRMIHPHSGEAQELTQDLGSLMREDAIVLYPPVPSKPQLLNTLLDALFHGNGWEYGHLIFVSILVIVIGFLFPIGNKVLFDYVIPTYNYAIYTQLFLALFVGTASSFVFTFCRSVLLLRFNGIFTSRLQISFWDRVLRLTPHFFQKMAKGDLLQRSMIFDQIRSTVGMGVLSTFANGIFSILYLIMMLIYSIPLTWIGLGLVGLWSVFSVFIMIIKIYYGRLHLASTGKIDAFLVQTLNAIGKIRSTATESRIFDKWSKEFMYNQSLFFKMLNWQNVLKASQSFMQVMLPLALFSYVIYTIAQTKEQEALMSPGTFLAFTAAFTPFSVSLMSMIGTVLSVIELVPFWQRVQPVLQAPLERTEAKIDPRELKGSVSLNQVSFRYGLEMPLVLKNITLSIEPEEFIGIVGKSGCGKSTLCRLLFGFEKPESGVISYDQQNLEMTDLEKIRKQVGFVFQNNKIFTGNILDNLICGGEFSAQKIDEILQITTFHEDLKNLPLGLDTLLSSAGGILSTGQKQKILLGRALLSVPKILILDEGLNSLDNQTQNKILQNLKKLKMTLIVVSHNLNILQNADKIYILEESGIRSL